ncbi:hypothetical protein [Photobacterium angustum]|uniref:Uncharacterized protein n=1 Tax=Photobacterium angustum TaxID=661 RepID=A0A2S7VXA7_PHOAN|nr:hypothetical protein [Photobacterium angustum]PQJ66174.1 hypothetical protein BTO08_01435 [Photobacterium angustum]
MKTVIKATIAAAIIATSFTAAAKDGNFTGNINFNKSTTNAVNVGHYQKQGTAERSHSGLVFSQHKAALNFSEKLLSAADK